MTNAHVLIIGMQQELTTQE